MANRVLTQSDPDCYSQLVHSIQDQKMLKDVTRLQSLLMIAFVSLSHCSELVSFSHHALRARLHEVLLQDVLQLFWFQTRDQTRDLLSATLGSNLVGKTLAFLLKAANDPLEGGCPRCPYDCRNNGMTETGKSWGNSEFSYEQDLLISQHFNEWNHLFLHEAMAGSLSVVRLLLKKTLPFC